MKKFLLTVLCVCLSLALIACAAPAAQAPADAPAADAVSTSSGSANLNLTMATGGTTGTYYPLGVAMTQVLNSGIEGMNMTPEATGASAENLNLIANDEADLAIVQNDVMSYAYNGEQNFEGKAIKDFASVATLYNETVQLVASKDSGISSVADLAGKRVSIGDIGSGVESNALQILEVYGLSTDDITVEHLGFGDSANAIKDGMLDAAFVTAGTPTAAITELNTTNPVTVISLDDDKMDELVEKYPFYLKVSIPADTYTDVGEVKTVAIRATLVCRPDMDEDLVYNITKTIFENVDTIAAAHAKGAEFNTTDAPQALPVDLHPGAQKYFEEVGTL